MIFIVDRETELILARFEAWAADSYAEAHKYIREHVLQILDEVITLNGDMVIWVR